MRTALGPARVGVGRWLSPRSRELGAQLLARLRGLAENLGVTMMSVGAWSQAVQGEVQGSMLRLWRGSFRGPSGLGSSRIWEPVEIGGPRQESPVSLRGP